ncbi:helix-turn-helix domain-containing protein [Hydrocarboniphaga effusa]|jgi:AraC family transcriptional activator of tynA and feaB|uniref:HTH araC/xylS-type domain-containing protein n=1 Tax=Hydrocarboniphaga effusa AP103 TaxID=1172194 RepID=I8TA19_9GAMM|nr:helix-turn-helix domain-containing protein [Hydrocarboniphaga effusa]EIT70490.1 hypothetical protein WQQ_06270 [Hydrocarboniphaga effusa AP103]
MNRSMASAYDGGSGRSQSNLWGDPSQRGFSRLTVTKGLVRAGFPWLEYAEVPETDSGSQPREFRLAECSLSIVKIEPGDITKPRQMFASSPGSGFVCVVWPIEGPIVVVQDNQECSVGRHALTFCDASRYCGIRPSAGATFAVFTAPHDWIPDWPKLSRVVCAKRLRDRFTVRAALETLFAGSQDAGVISDAQHDLVVESIRWRLTATLAQFQRDQAPKRRPNDRFERARQSIGEQISNPDLNADDIAASLFMSRRALYLLFKKHQITPAELIRDVRLDKAAEELLVTDCSTRKITDIAFDFGFSDCATFSRLFKQRFGTTPTEFRASAGRSAPIDGVNAEPRIS